MGSSSNKEQDVSGLMKAVRAGAVDFESNTFHLKSLKCRVSGYRIYYFLVIAAFCNLIAVIAYQEGAIMLAGWVVAADKAILAFKLMD